MIAKDLIDQTSKCPKCNKKVVITSKGIQHTCHKFCYYSDLWEASKPKFNKHTKISDFYIFGTSGTPKPTNNIIFPDKWSNIFYKPNIYKDLSLTKKMRLFTFLNNKDKAQIINSIK